MSKDKSHLLHKQWTLPAGLAVRSFVMRELDSRDEMEAARWADQRKGSAGGLHLQIKLRQHESMRHSLVMVNGEPVNVDGVPYMAFDEWSSKTMSYVLVAYGELNGVEDDDVEDFKQGATVYVPGAVGAPTTTK